ncbi:MAG: metallophosphoesterase family protein [Deltaproteobacteria bacterium]|nr:metallophosphoesterase family protein [Deltaproteobacteria bacterium]
MERIGVISDTHLTVPDETLKRIVRVYFSQVDLIVHLGDYVDYRVAAYLMEQGEFMGVAGNMDPPEVRDTLPVKQVLKLGRLTVGLIHGWGPPHGLEEKILREFGEVDAILYGHTHKAVNHEKEGVLFFNPGSAHQSFMGKPSIGIL